MRIVAGELRGRRLHSPKSNRIRPTTDRVREAVFSIIAPHIPEADVLDLFAGTGALGLEALSRGAARVVFIDQNVDAVRLIRTNIELCGVQDRARVVLGPAHQSIRRLAEQEEVFDLIFIDPPYGKGYLEQTLSQVWQIARREALAVVEHSAKEIPPVRCGEWLKIQERKYGDTAISIYAKDFPC